MSTAQEIKPSGVANRTEAQLSDQSIAYNQSDITYNEIGVTYGGVYGAQDARIIVGQAIEVKP